MELRREKRNATGSVQMNTIAASTITGIRVMEVFTVEQSLISLHSRDTLVPAGCHANYTE